MIALVRAPSPTLQRGERAFREPAPIDLALAVQQHAEYRHCLMELGAEVVRLAAEPELPDAVFVEDTAVVLDEVAVLGNPGVPSRRPEIESVAAALMPYRELRFIRSPGTLEGGDVLRVGRSLYVGLSQRTNAEGVDQLRDHVASFGYSVFPVPVLGCLHLRSACSLIDDGILLVNRSWIDAAALSGFELLDVPVSEPWAANAVRVGGAMIVAAGYPQALDLIRQRVREVKALDISEFEKAEGGVSCLSLRLKS